MADGGNQRISVVAGHAYVCNDDIRVLFSKNLQCIRDVIDWNRGPAFRFQQKLQKISRVLFIFDDKNTYAVESIVPSHRQPLLFTKHIAGQEEGIVDKRVIL